MMKIHVAHDKQGNIRSLAVPAPEFSDTLGIAPRQNEQISIVDGPDLQGDQLYRHLRDLSEHYRVDVSSGKPTLARK